MAERRLSLSLAPPPIKRIAPFVKGQGARVLDVGCAYGAPGRFKKFLPGCQYHALDRNEREVQATDRSLMTAFYEADLETDTLDQVPDLFFDAILLSHVIEHLRNGEQCIRRLVQKLKQGGVIYIEYPGVRSLGVPHGKRGFLHFHDDSTHVRLYSVPEVVNVLLQAGCQVVSAGTRRDSLRLAMTPFLALRALVQKGDIWSGRLWDFFGIAEFVLARKR